MDISRVWGRWIKADETLLMHEKGWYQTNLTDAETGNEIISVRIIKFLMILRENRYQRGLWICGRICLMFTPSSESIENLELGLLLTLLSVIGSSLNSLPN